MPIPALVLAVTTLLAASSSDLLTRIPGTKLRLGMSELQLMEFGSFPEAKVADAAGATARKGELKFFGVASEATLYFKGGFLSRAKFEAAGVSPKSQDYVEDQLRREKLMRECTRFAPGDHSCDWLGDVKIHVEIQKDKLTALAEAAPKPWETEPEAAATAAAVKPEPAPSPAAQTPAPAAAPTSGGTTPASAGSAPATGGSAPASPPSGATRTEPAPSSAAAPTTSPSTKPAAPVSPPPAPASPPPAPAVSQPAVAPVERPSEPVATLPETLKLSLPERNAPTEWPRMVSSPKLAYPDAARRESVQGIVWVLALVGPDGSVEKASIDRGIRELNDAAIAWVTKAKFAPCVRDGRPCRFWIRVAARFTMY